MTNIRYTKLAEILMRRIADEHYSVGTTMPTEKDLIAEFQSTRHTVRAALKQLQDLRLISRRRGSGTTVIAKTSDAGFSQSLSSLEDLIHLAASTPRQLRKVEEVVIDIDMARELGLAPGTRWLRFGSTRNNEDNNPIVWTEVYVDSQYRGIKKQVQKLPNRLISELIEENYGQRIASVGQDISACALPPSVAGILKVEPYSPGLFILRQYHDPTQHLVAVSTSYHPAGRYKFSTTLIREK